MFQRLLGSVQISRYSTTWVFANFNYVLFLAFLGIVYITNAHFAEKSVRDIQHIQKEIKELKWEYTSIKSQTMYKSMQSQMDVQLESTGLDLEPQGPMVIEY